MGTLMDSCYASLFIGKLEIGIFGSCYKNVFLNHWSKFKLRAGGSSLTGITVLWFLSKTIYPSLVLVQPRKTRPYISEILLMGHKESNQTYKQNSN